MNDFNYQPLLNRAYYQSTISNFLITNKDDILGKLVQNHSFSLDTLQRNAWLGQIDNLQQQLIDIASGHILFEFIIPRMGKRVDVALYMEGVVFVLEYKVGSVSHDKQAVDQVVDYCLDLKNFHEGSHNAYIVPILISTGATKQDNIITFYEDKIAKPLLSNGYDLSILINKVLATLTDSIKEKSAAEDWLKAGYKPTPTIVEAAQALYEGHKVENISRSDAGARNLKETSDSILEVIENSKQNLRKSICFLTGVPGSGKTLAGLNMATRTLDGKSEEHAVFLSGNGPLVTVLREALARDEVERSKIIKQPISKQEAKQKASTFIQNIHHFRDEGLRSENAPTEHVVIFDEAQRAWDQKRASTFMAERGYPEFQMSEPEFLIGYMDRKKDWCTVICLVGGGQEINRGESGLIEWFNALSKDFPHWDIYHSDQLSNKNYNWNEDLTTKLTSLNAIKQPLLHLDVSMRSFRTEKLSDFVSAIIDGDHIQASQIIPYLTEYKIVLTRDIDKARTFLNENARGTERTGLIASSGAHRLRPAGINIKSKIDPAIWFLNDKEDIRSSYYLEEVATEFDIQGLELDWTALCWDADLRIENGVWAHYNFKGTKWQKVNDTNNQAYLSNAYRVLLTRARQGMIIFIPRGKNEDYTRPKAFYDETYEFLQKCGLECVDNVVKQRGVTMSDLDDGLYLKPNATNNFSSIWEYARTIKGYEVANKLFGFDFMQLQEWWMQKCSSYDNTGTWDGSFEELRLCLFFYQRNDRATNPYASPQGEDRKRVKDLYSAIVDRWKRLHPDIR